MAKRVVLISIVVLFALLILAFVANEFAPYFQAFAALTGYFLESPLEAVGLTTVVIVALVVLFLAPKTDQNDLGVNHDDPIDRSGGGNF